MQPSPAKFSARAIKASWWLGTASLAFGLFIKITSELLEHEVSGVDRTILIGFAKARTPWLTVVAVDLTALGSVTLVVLISTIALCVLLLLKDRMGALQLVAASVGAGILTTTIKDYIDRPRPEVVTQLDPGFGLVLSQRPLTGGRIPLFDRGHSCVPASSKNRASNRDSGDDGWDHTAGGNDSHLPRSALPKRRRQWHIAWGGLGAFAGRVLFVFPCSQGHPPRAIVLWIERLPVP